VARNPHHGPNDRNGDPDPEIGAVPIRIFVSAAIAPGSTVARGGANETLYESTVLELVILKFNSHETIMKKMMAGKFKANCLAVIEEVQTTGEPVIPERRWKRVKK
jgi:hypothetical protein